MRIFLFLACVGLLVVACGSGCNSDSRRGGNGNGDGDGDGNGANGGDGGANLSGRKCSADLQSVTDANGALVQACPADQGCYGGACIPACGAASMSQGNVGCDFMAATAPFTLGIAPPCHAVFLANNWTSSVHITVSRGGTSYDATKFGRIATGSSPQAMLWAPLPATGLPPGQVAVLFLSSDPSSMNIGNSLACPVTQAVPGATSFDGSGKGQAFHVSTDVPVSAYDILPYGGAGSYLPSAELLLPTSAWGTNYVAAVPPFGDRDGGPRFIQVIASQDNTTIQINPTASLPAGPAVSGAPAGVVTSVTLNAGEYAQWEGVQQGVDEGEMSGSIISSDKPVVFVGGTAYLCLSSATSGGGGCDAAHQMVPPISALGSEYVAAPYTTRRASLSPESIPYRLVGAVDGTMLTYDPPVPGAPPTLKRGFVVDFQTTLPFTVTSQDAAHPFYVAQMMTGGSLNDGSRPGTTGGGFDGALGDEEFVNLVAPAQFLSKYVYFTDPTYGTTTLTLARVNTGAGFKDVTVDCLGVVKGWTGIGTKGTYEYAQVDLVRGGVGIGTCTNGPHEAHSDGQFGVMVWGTDAFASYAYPAGGNLGTISTAVVIP